MLLPFILQPFSDISIPQGLRLKQKRTPLSIGVTRYMEIQDCKIRTTTTTTCIVEVGVPFLPSLFCAAFRVHLHPAEFDLGASVLES